MKLNVIDCKGQKIRDQELDPVLFDVAERADILHQVILWQRAKKRAGTHSTKTRGMINGSTKKKIKQKGTGRARIGDGSSPHCKGGGVAFGPSHLDHSYKMNKKVRKLALQIAISKRQKENRLLIVEGIGQIEKTAIMAQTLQQLGVNFEKALIISNDNVRSTQNLAYANCLPVVGLNVMSILRHDILIIDAVAFTATEGRLK